MRRPNAPGHAAQVVDDEAWRDRADEQFVGVAVGLDLSPRDLELSVPGPVGRCQPQPALAAGVDLRQEPLDDFDLHHDAHPLASGTDPPVIRIATAICALGLVSDPPPYPYHDDDRMPRSPTYAPPVPRPGVLGGAEATTGAGCVVGGAAWAGGGGGDGAVAGVLGGVATLGGDAARAGSRGAAWRISRCSFCVVDEAAEVPECPPGGGGGVCRLVSASEPVAGEADEVGRQVDEHGVAPWVVAALIA